MKKQPSERYFVHAGTSQTKSTQTLPYFLYSGRAGKAASPHEIAQAVQSPGPDASKESRFQIFKVSYLTIKDYAVRVNMEHYFIISAASTAEPAESLPARNIIPREIQETALLILDESGENRLMSIPLYAQQHIPDSWGRKERSQTVFR